MNWLALLVTLRRVLLLAPLAAWGKQIRTIFTLPPQHRGHPVVTQTQDPWSLPRCLGGFRLSFQQAQADLKKRKENELEQ